MPSIKGTRTNKLVYVTHAELWEPWDLVENFADVEHRTIIIRVEDDKLIKRFKAAKVEMETCWELLSQLTRQQDT